MKHYSTPRNVRLDEEQAKKVDTIIDNTGLKWSDVVRLLVRKGLSAEEAEQRQLKHQPELPLTDITGHHHDDEEHPRRANGGGK